MNSGNAQIKIDTGKNKSILKDNSINLTLSDVLAITGQSEMLMSPDAFNENGDIGLIGRNDFLFDVSENVPLFNIQLLYNGEPATLKFDSFFASFVPGDTNERAMQEEYKTLNIVNQEDSIIELTIPKDKENNIFSKHKDGYSYTNYTIFGSLSGAAIQNDNLSQYNPGKGRINKIFLKGRIFRTDIIGDAKYGYRE